MTRSHALLCGTLAVGVLDILDAIIFFYVRNGVPPIRIFHSIAAGLIGRPAAIAGGMATALLGAALQFFIAFIVVLVYHLASWRIRGLTRHPLFFGVLYGVAVYVVMNFVVVPWSAAPPRGAMPTAVVVNGLLIHAFGVGLPAALSARWGLPSDRTP